MKLRISGSVFAVTMILLSGTAYAADSLKEALLEGTPYIDARYRFEYVEQDGLANDAEASTLRTRFGYKTGTYENFSAVLEFENITQVGDDDYNDTLNGRTTYPVVADVENTEVNQSFLQYTGIPETTVKLGRQVITLDGHRFVGHVGWRQNNQTFDAITISNKSLPDTEIRYGYINGVNRIFGDGSPAGDWDSDSHLFNISNTSTPLGKIVVYSYLLDFEMDAPAASNQSFGISLDGKQKLTEHLTGNYYGEYAFQQDYGSNTTDYDADYYHVSGGLSCHGLTTTVGYEVLGSDNGMAAFSTPLATLHKWNGWADVFLATPATGLEDFYVDVTYKVSGIEGDMKFLNGLLAKVQYHDFSAEEGSMDYGTEWGVYVKQPITKNVYAEVKYADYDTDGFATDRKKVVFGLGVTY